MLAPLFDLAIGRLRLHDARARASATSLAEVRAFLAELYPAATPGELASYGDGELLAIGRDAAGALIFFASANLLDLEVPGLGVVRVVESRMLAASRAARGRGYLHVFGSWCFARARLRRPALPVWGFGLCETPASYLSAVRTWPSMWPYRGEAETPAHVLALIDQVARTVDAERWDPQRGVMRGCMAVRESERRIPARPGIEADVRFFVERNPGYDRGDCLAVAGDANPSNLVRMLTRPLLQALARPAARSASREK